MVHVKDGIVGWELQANDYPQFNGSIPNHDRAVARGGSATPGTSTVLFGSNTRTCGRSHRPLAEARRRFDDPVDAWRSIVENPESRKAYTGKRGMGGFRRASWDDVVELIAASTIYTAKKYGPDGSSASPRSPPCP